MSNFDNLLFYVVSQDKAVRESIKVLLESYDAEVHSFSNGRSFLMNTHTIRPAYVLLEDEISDVNTLDLLKKIKEKNQQYQIILIVNSNYNHYNQEAERQSGVAAILHKPINSLMLLQLINNLK